MKLKNIVDMFQLNPAFADKNFKICELELCYLLLSNNMLFPWVILIPKRNDIIEIIDLNKEDRQLLIEEIDLVSRAMKKIFLPDKLNVAALGNIVPQLHIHIIARYKEDELWPNPTFGGRSEPYSQEKREEIIDKIRVTLRSLV